MTKIEALKDRPKRKEEKLTQDDVRAILKYEPSTGKLYWRHRPQKYFKHSAKRPQEKAQRAWNIGMAGKEALTNKDSRGYLRGRVLGENYQAHRLIWLYVYGEWPPSIDHINRNPSDNRISNLRICTTAQNAQNSIKKVHGSSRYRGVCWVKRDKVWRAKISNRMKKIHIGDYQNEKDAAEAYDKFAVRLHGEFAVTNFPLPTPPQEKTDD